MSFMTPAEFASDSYMGSTGTKPANAVQVAIDMAESDVSEALGFPLDSDGSYTFVAHQFVEEHRWPRPGRPLMLEAPRIITVDEVLALHDLGDCDCEWTELTACAFIYDALQGMVKFRYCERCASCWTRCSCPARVRVTYTAGFAASDVTADTPAGRKLRMAIALQARAHLDLMDFNTDGNVAIESYSSLGYSEKRAFGRTATGRAMGQSILSQAAADMLDSLIVKRGGGIMLRSQ